MSPGCTGRRLRIEASSATQVVVGATAGGWNLRDGWLASIRDAGFAASMRTRGLQRLLRRLAPKRRRSAQCSCRLFQQGVGLRLVCSCIAEPELRLPATVR